MATRRYRRQRGSSPLKVLLAFTMLMQGGPIRLPGVKRQDGLALICPNDSDELVDNGDGTCYCQHCGTLFEIV